MCTQIMTIVHKFHPFVCCSVACLRECIMHSTNFLYIWSSTSLWVGILSVGCFLFVCVSLLLMQFTRPRSRKIFLWCPDYKHLTGPLNKKKTENSQFALMSLPLCSPACEPFVPAYLSPVCHLSSLSLSLSDLQGGEQARDCGTHANELTNTHAD
jgi:hypothetical protein